LRSGRPSVEAVPPPNPPKVSNDLPEVTIVVDKPARNVRVYDRGGKFLAFYPATIGSEEKPAPSGDFKVKGVSWNPKYQYDPKFAWKGVNTKRKLSIGPGPNNPVGLVWIDLTDPTYGIHGTPAPSDIGKTQSHGCIRLTNWDAVELAGMVRPGDVVRFEDQDSPILPSAETAPVSETPRPELTRRGP
jgi:lipoprotein-anchoring transpeptidase ErfK/SrfK